MTAQIVDLDAEISALLHDVQSADPDAGPYGRSETPIGGATQHTFTDAQWDAWLEGPDDADLPGAPSPATQCNDVEVEVALNHTVGIGHGIYDAVSPDPDFHATTDEVPPQLADTTRLLTDLRAYFAAGRSTSAPTDTELQSIANIGSSRDDLGWLDSMLTERHGQSLTAFRAECDEALTAFHEEQSARASLGLPTTRVAAPVQTPTTPPPPAPPAPPTDGAQRNCGGCAERLGLSAFSSTQLKKTAISRRCKQCRANPARRMTTDQTATLEAMMRTAVCAALAEQASAFEHVVASLVQQHEVQLMAAAATPTAAVTEVTTVHRRQNQLRGFETPKFQGVAAVRKNPASFSAYSERLIDSVDDAADRRPNSTLTKMARLGIDDDTANEIQQLLAVDRTRAPPGETVPTYRDLGFDEIMTALNRVCFPTELRETFKAQWRAIRIGKSETVTLFHSRHAKQLAEAHPAGSPQLPAADMLQVHLQAIRPATALYECVVNKAVEGSTAFVDLPDAVDHARRWALTHAQIETVTNSLNKVKTIFVHAGWDAEEIADESAGFTVVPHRGNGQFGVSHRDKGIAFLIPGARVERAGSSVFRYTWDKTASKYTSKDCTLCAKNKHKHANGHHNMVSCPHIGRESSNQCWWCLGDHATKDHKGIPTNYKINFDWFQ